MKKQTTNKNQLQFKYSSVFGPIFIVASKKGLSGVYWSEQSVPFAVKSEGPQWKYIENTITEIEEYLNGRRKRFTVKLDIQGTDFQRRVWKELLKIPYGKTSTYSEIAKRIGKPTAIRAVGAANAQNAISILIPCHRIISSSGRLTGYSGGIRIKEKLLHIEMC